MTQWIAKLRLAFLFMGGFFLCAEPDLAWAQDEAGDLCSIKTLQEACEQSLRRNTQEPWDGFVHLKAHEEIKRSDDACIGTVLNIYNTLHKANASQDVLLSNNVYMLFNKIDKSIMSWDGFDAYAISISDVSTLCKVGRRIAQKQASVCPPDKSEDVSFCFAVYKDFYRAEIETRLRVGLADQPEDGVRTMAQTPEISEGRGWLGDTLLILVVGLGGFGVGLWYVKYGGDDVLRRFREDGVFDRFKFALVREPRRDAPLFADEERLGEVLARMETSLEFSLSRLRYIMRHDIPEKALRVLRKKSGAASSDREKLEAIAKSLAALEGAFKDLERGASEAETER